jgi:hypothetical protein
MANGFALRGFTTGFTTGLQNVNQLVNSATEREMLQRRTDQQDRQIEMEQQQQDRMGRYYDALINNQDRDNNRLDQEFQQKTATFEQNRLAKEMEFEQARKKQELTDIWGKLSAGADISDEDLEKARSFGIPDVIGAPEDAPVMRQLAEDLKAGKRTPNDPEVRKYLDPIMQQMMQRRIGDVVVHPVYGNKMRVAMKAPAGFDQVDGGWMPNVLVQGASDDPNRKYMEYTGNFTKFGAQSPVDPAVMLNDAQLSGKLMSAAQLNERLHSNPALRTKLIRATETMLRGPSSPVSPFDASRINLNEERANTESLRREVMQWEGVLAKRKALGFPIDKEMEWGLQRKKQQLLDAQTGYYGARADDVGMDRVGGGLGGARGGRPASRRAEAFDVNKAKSWLELNGFAPANSSDILPPEKIEIGRKIASGADRLMREGQGMIDQNTAMAVVAQYNGKPVEATDPKTGVIYVGYPYRLNGRERFFAIDQKPGEKTSTPKAKAKAKAPKEKAGLSDAELDRRLSAAPYTPPKQTKPSTKEDDSTTTGPFGLWKIHKVK